MQFSPSLVCIPESSKMCIAKRKDPSQTAGLVGLEFNGPVNTIKVMLCQSHYENMPIQIY